MVVVKIHNSIWKQFLKSKYCQRDNLVEKKFDTGQSLVWKFLMNDKHKLEDHIKWQIKSGSCSFWWDDWLGIGALAKYNNNISSFNNDSLMSF